MKGGPAGNAKAAAVPTRSKLERESLRQQKPKGGSRVDAGAAATGRASGDGGDAANGQAASMLMRLHLGGIPEEVSGKWDTTKNSVGYHAAMYQLAKVDEYHEQVAVERAEARQLRGESYFPMSLDDGAFRPATKAAHYMSNQQRIEKMMAQPAVSRDMPGLNLCMDMSRRNTETDYQCDEAVATRQPTFSAEYYIKEPTPAPGCVISLSEPRPRHGSSGHGRRTAADDGAAPAAADPLLQSYGGETSFAASSALLLRTDGFGPSDDAGGGGGCAACDGLRERLRARQAECRKELASLFNAAQQTLHASAAEPAPARAPSLAIEAARRASKQAAPPPEFAVCVGEESLPADFHVLFTGGGAAQAGHEVTPPGIEYTTARWSAKKAALQAVLAGAFDLDAAADLVAAARRLREQLAAADGTVRWLRSELVREKRKALRASTGSERSRLRGRYRRGQVVTVAQHLEAYLGEHAKQQLLPLLQRAGLEEHQPTDEPSTGLGPTIDDGYGLWGELHDAMVKLREGISPEQVLRSDVHQQLVGDLRCVTLVEETRAGFLRRLEAAERAAMEGSELMSAAGEVFTVGSSLAPTVAEVINCARQLDRATSESNFTSFHVDTGRDVEVQTDDDVVRRELQAARDDIFAVTGQLEDLRTAHILLQKQAMEVGREHEKLQVRVKMQATALESFENQKPPTPEPVVRVEKVINAGQLDRATLESNFTSFHVDTGREVEA
eukprot:gene21582-33202_t